MKAWAISLLLLAALLTGAPATAQFSPVADKGGPQTRDLTGMVLSKSNEAALPDAIVYLKNTKTHAVKTFITGNDGRYRFPALALNADYEVYAEHDGKRSDTKTLSSFDSRAQASITLRIDSAK